MPRQRLTDASIARLRPPAEGRLEVWDTLLPAFGVRLSHTGRARYIVAIRRPGSRNPARHTIGEVGRVSLKDARASARELLGDPGGTLSAPRTPSVAAVVDQWLARDQAGNRTAAEARRIMHREVVPTYSSRPITDLTKADILTILDAIVDRGAPVAANRTLAYLRRMLSWAASRDIIPINPAQHVTKPVRERSRDRTLSDAELAAVWHACGALGAYGAGVRLLILTGCRRDEIFGLTWSEVDLEAGVLRLPPERIKVAEGRTVALSPPACAILAALPRKGPYVVSTTGQRPYTAWTGAKARLDAASGVSGWRLHDLRRTCATGLQRLGVRLEAIEAVLGHTSGSRGGIVGVYQRHRFESEARSALEAWAAEIERINGRQTDDDEQPDRAA